MPYLKINGLTAYYEINGNGPPLVLLPGLLGTIESDWRRFIPALAKNYSTVAVDLRGHGRTNNPDPLGKTESGELHVGRLVEDLNGLLDQLGLEQTSILGYSLGGCIGLAAGLKQPGRIQALVMHATKFLWNEASISTMQSSLDPDIILEKNPRYAQTLQKNHGFTYGDDYWKTLLKTAARFISSMPEESPNLTQAAKADFPILVSVGDHDHLVGPEEATQLCHYLHNGELLVLPATRHAIQTAHVDPFLAAGSDFLRRNLKG